MKALVLPAHHRIHHRAGFKPAAGLADIKPQQGLGDPACSQQLARRQHQHLVGQSGDLLQRVGHIDYRQAKGRGQIGDIGQKLRLAVMIERGQRFIHQQQARAGQQRAPDRHPLALPA